MRSKLFLHIFLAVLWCTTSVSAVCLSKTDEKTPRSKLSCLNETTLKVANRDLVITLPEAERIKLTVEKYLAQAKPKQKSSLPGPGEVFIDCSGTVRMGAWILEPAFSAKPELRLTIRTHNSELVIVRREIRLQQTEGKWKVVGDGHTTYHRKSS